MKTVCLDFDGVIHSYTSGWQGVTAIPDRPVPGAKEAIEELSERFIVAIYSSRSGQPGGIEAIKQWWSDWKMPLNPRIKFPTSKPPALLYVDDRGYRFDGDWSMVVAFARSDIQTTPWNKQQGGGA